MSRGAVSWGVNRVPRLPSINGVSHAYNTLTMNAELMRAIINRIGNQRSCNMLGIVGILVFLTRAKARKMTYEWIIKG